MSNTIPESEWWELREWSYDYHRYRSVADRSRRLVMLEAVRLVGLGASIRSVATAAGVSRATVRSWIEPPATVKDALTPAGADL